MNNDYKGSSWSERFSWIVTIAAMVLVAILSIGLLCALFIQPQEEKKEDTEQTAISEQAAVIDSEGNAMDGDTVYPMPAKMSFNAQTFAQVSEPSSSATVTSDESVDVRIQAYVTPDDAVNKEVDFSVAWGNAPTHGSEDVTDYLTVTPDSDGSTMATVSCKKAFGDDTIIITVTTREGGYTATCTVSFTGIASGIEITSSTAAKKSTSERGTYYELGTSKTYTFDIGLTNAFDDVASDLTVTEIGGEGNMYFGSRYSNDGGYYNYEDIYQKNIGELADKFITSATISGTTLTIKTGSSVLENYYSEYAYDEWDYYYAKDAFLVELDDYWNIKGPSDTFYNDNSKYNAQNIGSCYFYVTVKDNVSGLSETVRLWLVSSVSGVSLSQTELEF